MGGILAFIGLIVVNIYIANRRYSLDSILNAFLFFQALTFLLDGLEIKVSMLGINAVGTDLFGFTIIAIFIQFVINNKTIFNYSDRPMFYLKFYVLSFILAIILSISKHGVSDLQSARSTIYAVVFFMILPALFKSSYSYYPLFKFYRNFVVLIFIKYLLTFLGFFPLPYSEHSYSALRFITNTDVLILLTYYIFVSLIRRYYKLSLFEKITFAISFLLIITSTQRALTIIFILYLVIDMMFINKAKARTVLIVLGFLITVPFIFSQERITLFFTAFTDISENYEKSNAYYKQADIIASIEYLIESGDIYLGVGFADTIFERETEGFRSSEDRGIHNLFIMQLARGGLLLFVPLVLLWLYLLFSNIKLAFTQDKKFLYQQVAFWWMATYFLFNNTSGQLFASIIIISYALNVSDFYIDDPADDKVKVRKYE